MLIALLVVSALVSATVSGIVGMAGGTMLLGAMVVLGMAPDEAVPVHAAVQLVSNFTRTYAHLPTVRWHQFAILAAAALPGPILGLYLLDRLDSDTVRALMGLLILYSVWAPKWGLARLSDTVAFATAGAFAGVLGVVVGAVGPLLAPFFLRDSFKKESLIGTKAICQGYLHVIKLVAFAGLYPVALTHRDASFDLTSTWTLILPMALATIVGTYAGKWLLHRMSEARFVQLYKVVLTGLAVRLIYQGVF